VEKYSRVVLKVILVMTRSLCQDLPKSRPHLKEPSGILLLGHFAEVSLMPPSLVFAHSHATSGVMASPNDPTPNDQSYHLEPDSISE
jgi:hypothetical protein